MSRFQIIPILAAIVTLHGSTASAQDALQSPQNQILRFAFSSKPYDEAARAELAKQFGAYCSGVLESLPTNTPAEAAWVTEEAKTTDDAKIARLTQTKEWARHQLKEVFSTCSAKVSEIQAAQSRKHRVFESASFLSLALDFNDSGDLQFYAKQIGAKDKLLAINSLRRTLMIAALRTLDSP